MQQLALGVELKQPPPGVVRDQEAAACERLQSGAPSHADASRRAADRAHNRAVGRDLDDLARRCQADQRVAVREPMRLVGETLVAARGLKRPHNLAAAIDLDHFVEPLDGDQRGSLGGAAAAAHLAIA